MSTCERCGKRDWFVDQSGTFAIARPSEATDYCWVCSKNLCQACMMRGHCNHSPALSGYFKDNGDPYTGMSEAGAREEANRLRGSSPADAPSGGAR